MPVRISRSRYLQAPTGGGGGGQLAAGQRAGTANVGYLGSSGALTVLNPGGSSPAGTSWDGTTLEVTGSNVTLDHYRINGAVVATGSNFTLTNSEVFAPSGTIFVVTVNGTGKGTLTVTDCTVHGASSGATYHVNGISSDSALIARRNDVSGSGDGIHANSTAGIPSLISQNYIHDLASVDVDQHLDGFQLFNFQAGTVTVEHNYVAMPDTGVAGVSSAMTCGTEVGTDPIITVIIDNNYFNHGAFTLRLNDRLANCAVTDNDFGQNISGEFGELSVNDAGCLLAGAPGWDNNRNYLGNLISRPT